MEQLSFLDPIEKSVSGATWWAGNYQCRNWHGYYQTRERGAGPWQFVVYAFGDKEAVIYAINNIGSLYHWRVLMDAKDRLLIDGKRYGPRF
ncbi:hypothetical protein [Shimia aestuarii]|uniref:hypothetical protein n=1 Tax=Shimia aestuarii TaxID=254406 RepID=UPI001FB21C82|nr:hypothetical protein [Shimia aestuarii]